MSDHPPILELERDPPCPTADRLTVNRRPRKARTLRHRATVAILSAGLCCIAAVGVSASPASAASPSITVTCRTGSNCAVRGFGFTPAGQVTVQVSVGTTVVSSYSVEASEPTEICSRLTTPVCHQFGGGTFTTVLPADVNLACGATTGGTVRVTDVSTGLTASDPVTVVGACATPTTTILSLPSTVDTGWTSSVNPAQVTATSTPVTSGTITITVNGTTVCTYNAGASSGCTLANLPAGTDQIHASYSGSSVPLYAPSSATSTVTVLPVFGSAPSTSLNWAGYVDTNEMYTSVSGTWTVPKANCGNFPFGDAASASATWVGIDGNTTNPVEQIGTDSLCIGWKEHYWAWWEMFPNGPTVIDLNNYPVHSGDQVTANVMSTGTPGSYTLTLSDATQGWTYSTTQSVAGAVGGSAEWITEQPSDSGLPLTNFGSVTFTQARATGSNGVATPIWDHPNLVMNMTSGPTVKAAVSPLSNDGTEFTITWLHS